mgnify:CR=1 FL=1
MEDEEKAHGGEEMVVTAAPSLLELVLVMY